MISLTSRAVKWFVNKQTKKIVSLQTIHSLHVKINTLNVKADLYSEHIILFKIGKITLLILDEESDIFMLIFDAMHSFPANDEIQKLGCKALHVLFERGILKCQIP